MNTTSQTSADRISEEASIWIARLNGYDADEQAALEQDRIALKAWMAQSPAHAAELKAMASLWGELNVLTELAAVSPALQQSWSLARGWQSLVGGVTSSMGNTLNALFNGSGKVAFASVALLAVIAISVLQTGSFSGVAPQVYMTAVGEQREVVLDDGSILLVNTNSHVTVDYKKNGRYIYLSQGQVHFDVAHNPERPFKVYAGNGMVRAVGTAFTVYRQEQGLEVTVTEGRVELNSLTAAINLPNVTVVDDGEPVLSSLLSEQDIPAVREILAVVKAGQNVQLNQVSQAIDSLASMSDDVLAEKIAWHTGMLRFSGEPLQQVIDEVGRYTPINIEITDPALSELRVGGFFKVGETDKMFEALSTHFGVHVEHINSTHVQLSLAIVPVKAIVQ